MPQFHVRAPAPTEIAATTAGRPSARNDIVGRSVNGATALAAAPLQEPVAQLPQVARERGLHAQGGVGGGV